MVGAPVQPRRGPPGYLYVAHEDEDRRFSSDDAETVTALASAAALVLDTYRLVTDGPERLRWLDAIAELIHLLHGDIGREEGLQGIADLLRKAASADTAVIVLSERAEGDAQAAIEAASGLGADLMQGASLSRGHFLTVVMESGRAVLTDDVPNMRSALPTPSEWLEALSVLGPGLFVPLGTQVQTVGALFVAWRRDSPHGRHAADVSTLAIPFAQATTLVLQRHETARLHARQQRWMATGAEITRSLLTEVEPQAVMSQVTRQIRDISGAAFAAVILTDHIGPRGTVRFDVIDGLGLEDASGSRVPCPSPLDIVIESGQPIITSDLVRDERYRPPSMWREALSVLGLTMLVPLRAPQEVQGVLVVGWERGSPEERAARNDAPLVESFADQIALSLQQTRVCQDRERRQSWLDAFGDLTRRLANDAEQEATLRRVIRLLRQVSGADVGAIILVDPAAIDSPSLVIFEGYGEHRYTDYTISNRGLVAAVIQSGRAFVSEDITHEDGYDPSPELADQLAGLGLGMVIPLVAAGEVLGVLVAGWRRGSPYERPATREVALVETFADKAAIALQRSRIGDQKERSERWLDATSEMARLLIGQVDRDEAMHLVLRQLRGVSGADFGGIMLVDCTDSTILRVVSIEGPGIAPVATDARVPRAGLAARVIATGRRIISDDYTHLEGHQPPPKWRDALSSVGLGMMIPLAVADADDVLGVLFVGWRRGSPSAGAARHEVQEIQTFADLAALALQRVRTQDDREHLRRLEDHEQIAHELHDTVLQRLFAVGLRLQTASAAISQPHTRARLRQAIGDLDKTTDQVRQTLSRLASDDPGSLQASGRARDDES